MDLGADLVVEGTTEQPTRVLVPRYVVWAQRAVHYDGEPYAVEHAVVVDMGRSVNQLQETYGPKLPVYHIDELETE